MIADTLALYARGFRKGAILALRNWPVGLVIVVYGVLIQLVTIVAAPFGMVGGLFVYLVLIACFSSWLSLVAQVLRVGRIRFADVPAGFSAYFGDLLNVGFIFWGLQRFFARAAMDAPLVVALDGLQWSDRPSLDLIVEFLRRAEPISHRNGICRDHRIDIADDGDDPDMVRERPGHRAGGPLIVPMTGTTDRAGDGSCPRP